MSPHEFQALSIPQNTSLHDALAQMNKTARGILLVIDPCGELTRTLTDGDLRRALLEGHCSSESVSALPYQLPITVTDEANAGAVLALMDKHQIDHVPLIDISGKPVDVMLRRELTQRIWLSSPHLGDEETAFVEDAFRTNWIAPLGPHVDGFERELAVYAGVAHAAALSSGTAAIHLGLLLLGVVQGDTVFCSSLTFVGSCNPILYCGAKPVFIDSEPQSWNMSPAALERALVWAQQENCLPRCVIIVNLYGQSADMDALLPICERYGIPVLEDAAESLGATYKGRASGSFGRVGIFSFNGNKIITTSGGGMLVSDDSHLVERARKLATQARDPAPHYEHTEPGFNYRMSNVLAGIGRGQLKVLNQRVKQRRAVFAKYYEAFANLTDLEWMPEPPACTSTRWLTCLAFVGNRASEKRDAVMRHLERHSIEARPVWKPMHLQPLFAGAPYFGHEMNSDVGADLYARGLCLPSGSNLSDSEIERVILEFRRAVEIFQ